MSNVLDSSVSLTQNNDCVGDAELDDSYNGLQWKHGINSHWTGPFQIIMPSSWQDSLKMIPTRIIYSVLEQH